MRNPFENPTQEAEDYYTRKEFQPIPLDRIKTSNICPPIPTRAFDWVAWIDGMEEDGPQGYGKTQEEALTDLHADWEMRHG